MSKPSVIIKKGNGGVWPYQVQLDDGEVIFARTDMDATIRCALQRWVVSVPARKKKVA